ncbi:MAG TPA: hydantoinase B/oxoprolinase family protein, partial [Bryobacteraceae bacterium]
MAEPDHRPVSPDPIELAICKSSFHAIAEEMGAVLRRTAFSPNIKERRDYSSAVFDAQGRVIAMGDHMPVHLGSMPRSVEAALAKLSFSPGDIAILNDPFAGGTHLPDITLVMPVFVPGVSDAAFYVANRAHHADVGGMYPGSMGLCREIWQEGLRIPPVKLVSCGVMNEPLLALLLNNVRTPKEREGDLTAQIGSCRVGAERLLEMVSRYGMPRIEQNMIALLDHSERLMRALLRSLPEGEFYAQDYLDNDGITAEPVKICVAIRTDPAHESLQVDFTGSASQVSGSLNAVAAITWSA